MSEYLRLDKYLTDMMLGSRSEVKAFIKKGKIFVNGIMAERPEIKVLAGNDQICFGDREISYKMHEYIMLNKPKDVITATVDKKETTVLDLIIDSYRKDLFPVGRLDKDTEGLLLITNDGELAHNLLSPKKHIAKTYYVKVSGIVTNKDRDAFQNGVMIEEELKTLPATLRIIKSDAVSEVLLTIFEGKFHQVKRMFEAVDKQVVYLKRLSMGSLLLDKSLLPGEYRELTKDEIDKLKSGK